MKKLIAVPIVAVVAAVGAASAAGFAGGVSAGPVQSGQTNDLACAYSASRRRVGHRRAAQPVPTVDNAADQADRLGVPGPGRPPDRAELQRVPRWLASRSVGSAPAWLRVRSSCGSTRHAGGIPVENLNAIRITVDPGYPGMPVGGENARY